MKKLTNNKLNILISVILLAVTLMACGEPEQEVVIESQTTTQRSNETVVLEPVMTGEKVIGTDSFQIDCSNAGEGYIGVNYTGENEEVRLQISCNGGMPYNIIVPHETTFLPLFDGSGTYSFIGFESIRPGEYATTFSETMDIAVEKQTGPYLYPNMFVNFSKDSEAVALAKSLAEGCTCDIEVISSVYKYVTENIEYDHELAETVQADYLPNVDTILETRKGICLDYAALMASMLRSQRIPTRLEIGYAGTAYHAWVSSYIEDVGWINGVIQFDGTDWTLMDPTFAANTSASDLKSFIGDGENYVTKYVY